MYSWRISKVYINLTDFPIPIPREAPLENTQVAPLYFSFTDFPLSHLKTSQEFEWDHLVLMVSDSCKCKPLTLQRDGITPMVRAAQWHTGHVWQEPTTLSTSPSSCKQRLIMVFPAKDTSVLHRSPCKLFLTQTVTHLLTIIALHCCDSFCFLGSSIFCYS